MKKYLKEYKWSNIFAMLRNQKLDPEICTDDFNDRLIVITGATSGIGSVTASKYAAHGADILCINRNERKSQDLCETLEKQYDVVLSRAMGKPEDIYRRLIKLTRIGGRVLIWTAKSSSEKLGDYKVKSYDIQGGGKLLYIENNVENNASCGGIIRK